MMFWTIVFAIITAVALMFLSLGIAGGAATYIENHRAIQIPTHLRKSVRPDWTFWVACTVLGSFVLLGMVLR